jgi:hypothetical protein
MKFSSLKFNAIILLVVLITSVSVTSGSGYALPKKESKSIEKFVDRSALVLEIEEAESIPDDVPSADVYPNFQPAHTTSKKLLASFSLQVSVFQPQLRTTFTNAP